MCRYAQLLTQLLPGGTVRTLRRSAILTQARRDRRRSSACSEAMVERWTSSCCCCCWFSVSQYWRCSHFLSRRPSQLPPLRLRSSPHLRRQRHRRWDCFPRCAQHWLLRQHQRSAPRQPLAWSTRRLLRRQHVPAQRPRRCYSSGMRPSCLTMRCSSAATMTSLRHRRLASSP